MRGVRRDYKRYGSIVAKIKIGDYVTPVTSAGLQLADIPVDGTYEQKRAVARIFRGIGRVVKTHDVIIDYDTWPSEDDFYLGKINYRDCLIECDAGTGWGGAGAVKIVKPLLAAQNRAGLE